MDTPLNEVHHAEGGFFIERSKIVPHCSYVAKVTRGPEFNDDRK